MCSIFFELKLDAQAYSKDLLNKLSSFSIRLKVKFEMLLHTRF
jgi:hypothetical protein